MESAILVLCRVPLTHVKPSGFPSLRFRTAGTTFTWNEKDDTQGSSMSDPTQSKPTGLAAATALAALNSAQYQDAAIVSRELVRKAQGGVTAFAFDAGERLSEHTAPFDALVHVLEGEAEIRVNGQPHRVRAGELFLMPANQPHAVEAAQRFKMLLIMIRG
jgi:quercetin dioxygenase-like cupin family protein